MSAVLLNVIRANRTESVHRGNIAVVDTKKTVVDCVGDVGQSTFWRSAAKPFQAIPLVAGGGLDRYHLTEGELALMTASHSGEIEHVATVERILAKVDLTVDHLACGAARPMSGQVYRELIRQGKKPQAVHNACSGKHAAMLALCRLLDLPVSNYIDACHSVQRMMHHAVAQSVCLPVQEVEQGIDGCGVPVFYLPLYNMALAYARLAAPEQAGWLGDETAVAAIRDAMLHYPQMVAGTGRIDTAIMTLTKGRILAKIGAEAVYCLGSAADGIGVAVKIEDGSLRALEPVVLGILKRLDLVTRAEYDALAAQYSPILKNHRGDVIGTIETAF